MEEYHLLPCSHFGGRKGTSTEHTVQALLEVIHTAWKDQRVASVLLLDVSRAFDNVFHKRLLHNLRKRKIGGAIAKWIESFVSQRATTLKLPDHSEDFVINTGIPQGSPLSPILYLFYNLDLLDWCTNQAYNTHAPGYIDDLVVIATGNSEEETCAKLTAIHERATEWASKHASVFAFDKYKLLHFKQEGTTPESTGNMIIEGKRSSPCGKPNILE